MASISGALIQTLWGFGPGGAKRLLSAAAASEGWAARSAGSLTVFRPFAGGDEQHATRTTGLCGVPGALRYDDVAATFHKLDRLGPALAFKDECHRARQQAHDLIAFRMHFPHSPIRLERMTHDEVLVVEVSELTSRDALPEFAVYWKGLDRRIGPQSEIRGPGRPFRRAHRRRLARQPRPHAPPAARALPVAMGTADSNDGDVPLHQAGRRR